MKKEHSFRRTSYLLWASYAWSIYIRIWIVNEHLSASCHQYIGLVAKGMQKRPRLSLCSFFVMIFWSNACWEVIVYKPFALPSLKFCWLDKKNSCESHDIQTTFCCWWQKNFKWPILVLQGQSSIYCAMLTSLTYVHTKIRTFNV